MSDQECRRVKTRIGSSGMCVPMSVFIQALGSFREWGNAKRSEQGLMPHGRPCFCGGFICWWQQLLLCFVTPGLKQPSPAGSPEIPAGNERFAAALLRWE